MTYHEECMPTQTGENGSGFGESGTPKHRKGCKHTNNTTCLSCWRFWKLLYFKTLQLLFSF